MPAPKNPILIRKWKEKLSIALKNRIPWNKGKHPEYMQGFHNPAWKGGITKHNGYIYIHKPKHPFNNNGYVKRTRLVAEKYLGHYLTKKDITHHINGIKNDDRPENIKIITRSEHAKIHMIFHPNLPHQKYY